MKHLKLFPFGVAVLLAAVFLTLPPNQSRAVVMLPPTNVVSDVSEDMMKNPRVASAVKAARDYVSKQNYTGDVSITVTTNVPAGFTYTTDDIGVPKTLICAGLLMVIVQVVVVVIILGVAVYIVYKIVKWITCTVSNANWIATNNTGGDLNWGSENKSKSLSIPEKALANPTVSIGWLGNPRNNMVASDLNNIPYNLQLLSASTDLKSWTPAYDISFKCGDGNTAPIIYDMMINGVIVNPQTNSIITEPSANNDGLITTITLMAIYNEPNPPTNFGLFRAVAPVPTLTK